MLWDISVDIYYNKNKHTAFTPWISNPRAATSVAINKSSSSSLNLRNASNLWGWDRLPCNSPTYIDLFQWWYLFYLYYKRYFTFRPKSPSRIFTLCASAFVRTNIIVWSLNVRHTKAAKVASRSCSFPWRNLQISINIKIINLFTFNNCNLWYTLQILVLN